MATDTEGDSVLRRRTAVNSVSNVGGTVFSLAMGFVLTPFILHRVGATDYGLWMLAASLVSYGALLDFGVANAVTKYVASYQKQGDLERLRGVVATGLGILVLAGLFVLLASLALAFLLPSLFKIPAGQESTARWLVVLSGLGVAVSLPTATTLAVLRGLQRFDLVNLVSAIAVILYAAVVVAILLLGGGVVEIAAATIPLELAMQVPMVLAIRLSAPELKLGLRGATRELVRSVASFGTAQFLMDVSAQARTRFPEVAIGASLPVARVTSYSIARRLGDVPSMLSYQFAVVLMPLASELHAGYERSRLRAVQIASTRIALAIVLSVGCPLLLLAQPFLVAWVGPRYADDSKLVLILTGAGIAATVGWPSSAMLSGMGRNRVLALFATSCALLSIGLSIALIRPFGLTGVALGVLIGTAVESLGLVLPYGMRVTGVRPASLATSALLPAILPALPATGVLYLLREAVHPASLVATAAVGLLGAVVYAGFYLSQPSTAAERELLRALLSRCIRFVRGQTARGQAPRGE